MTEWKFLTEVVELADRGVLLDVNKYLCVFKIITSIQKHYVERMPPERIAQIHTAGHSKFEKYILDTHDHPVIDPVWQLYARAIELAGSTATLLE